MAKYLLNTTVEILGAMWTVKTATEEEEPRLRETDGFTDWTTHLICVSDVPDNCDCNLDDPLEYVKKVIRHEVVHAFMFESGLAESWKHDYLGQEEMTVDWIAIQLPKITKVVDKICGEIQESKDEDAPKTGNEEPLNASKWVRTSLYYLKDEANEKLMCPRCGFTHEFIDGHTSQYKYCPQCGVHMTGIALKKKHEKDMNSQTSADTSSPDYKDWHHYEWQQKLVELEEIERMLSNEIKKDEA